MLSKTLPVLACLSLVGTAGGVWLGGAAVGEIDPFFFSPPESSFVSDRMPYQSPDWAEVQIGEYEQQGLLEGIGRGPMPGAVYAAPAVASYGESWAAAADGQAEPARSWSPPEDRPRRWARDEEPVRVWTASRNDPAAIEAEWERVERYARYPVTEDEADVETAEAEPELYAAAYEAPAE